MWAPFRGGFGLQLPEACEYSMFCAKRFSTMGAPVIIPFTLPALLVVLPTAGLVRSFAQRGRGKENSLPQKYSTPSESPPGGCSELYGKLYKGQSAANLKP